MQYLGKRDDRGVLLSYSAFELAYTVTNNAIKIIKSTEVYDSLIMKLPKKYIDLNYMKMIYEAFSPIAHQLVIYKYDKQHHRNLDWYAQMQQKARKSTGGAYDLAPPPRARRWRLAGRLTARVCACVCMRGVVTGR